MVRQRVLVPSFAGSNPASLAKYKKKAFRPYFYTLLRWQERTEGSPAVGDEQKSRIYSGFFESTPGGRLLL